MAFPVAKSVIGNERTFIIAEIGQNHQGDIEIAKQMISEAKSAGADCVKFQKSSLSEKFTKNALQRKYDGPYSWGKTYGDHKKYLEFNIEQYKLLQQHADKVDILFTASAMDVQSLDDLDDLNVPVIKIGSGDANNIPLLVKAAQLQKPLIISTGMQNEAMVHRIVEIMQNYGKTNYCLLHCVSAYPTPPENVNLQFLGSYRGLFPKICLGYSGHEQGIAISAAAVLLGAKVIERHFTLDKQQKGTDHKLSLEPTELRQMVSLIRSIENIKAPIGGEKIMEILAKFVTETELHDIKLAIAPVHRKCIQYWRSNIIGIRFLLAE